MLNKILIVVILISSSIISQNDLNQSKSKAKFSIGAQVGMFNGFGGQISLLTEDFAENFPFSIKLAVGFSSLDAGDPLGTRRIFINNNTNGIPEKSGKTWSYSLDFLYSYSLLGMRRNYLYVGPRYLMFTGNFNFVGGNEDFDVTTNQWGVGLGIENYFKIVSSFDLVVNLGYNYYFPNTLYGHDTSYSKENQNVNPRENYTFDDADEVVNQPKGEIQALIGVKYGL